MKKSLFPYFLFLLFCTSCGSSFQVTYHDKLPAKPYSKVLLVFVDEGCAFTLFDSLTYDICLKSSFLNVDKFDRRVQVEDALSTELTSSGTTIVKSYEVLDIGNNSYDYFMHMIDTSHFDAILLVNFRLFEHDNSNLKYLNDNPRLTKQEKERIYDRRTISDEGLECHLMPAKNIQFPIWEARMYTRGSATGNGPGRYLPRRVAIVDMAKFLKHDGYWMP